MLVTGGRRAMASTVVVVLGLGLVAPAAAEAPAPVRILLVGDSITHGSTGDWTWCYRLAEQLTAQDMTFELVGPASDLFPGSMDYIDPDFDRDHAAVWGMTAETRALDVGALVVEHQPDVVIEMLGVNDLTWLAHSPETVVDRVATMTEEIRSVDPDVDVLVSEVPATWFAGVPEFNDRLSAFAAAADDPASRTVLVDADRDYARDLHTYDAVHPSSLGEQSLAFAALDALATIGVGSGSPAAAPAVPLGPRLVPALAGRADIDSVLLEWSANRGADRQYVWWRDVTSGSGYARFAEPVVGTWTRVQGVSPSHRYAFVLQPAKGVHEAAEDVRSNEVQVAVAAPIEPQPPVAVEETPAPPPTPVPTGAVSVTPHLQPTPDAVRPRLRAKRLPGGRVRLSWHNVTRRGPVAIQVRMAGTWLTWRVVARARDTLVTGGFSHRKRTVLRLRDSSGATSRSVIIRRP